MQGPFARESVAAAAMNIADCMNNIPHVDKTAVANPKAAYTGSRAVKKPTPPPVATIQNRKTM
jgi:hypothetical protein